MKTATNKYPVKEKWMGWRDMFTLIWFNMDRIMAGYSHLIIFSTKTNCKYGAWVMVEFNKYYMPVNFVIINRSKEKIVYELFKQSNPNYFS